MPNDADPARDVGYWSETARCIAAHLAEVIDAQRTMPTELMEGPYAHARGFIAAAIEHPDGPEYALARATLRRSSGVIQRTPDIRRRLLDIAEVLQWLGSDYAIIGPDLARARETHAFFQQLAHDGDAAAPAATIEFTDGAQRHG